MEIINNTDKAVNPVKQYIKELLTEKLQNFELVEGAQQRTVGDLIERKITEILYNSNNELISEKRLARSKKSIEDITLISNGITYYVDSKTHDMDSDFSMPNLSSINKIRKLSQLNNKDLIYVLVSYVINDRMFIIKDIKVFFIWELDSTILGIGALGNGQLQIKNANKNLFFTSKEKFEWYSDFKKLVQDFLNKRIIKIKKQILEWE
jgi:hypothetical protein